MDYAKIAAEKFQQHFPKFGSFRKPCVYKEMSGSTRDLNTGNSSNIELSSHDIQIIFDSFPFSMNQAQDLKTDDIVILRKDRVAIFPSLDLPVTPKVNDMIIDDDGLEWTVIGIQSDPKPVAYSLHVRPVA